MLMNGRNVCMGYLDMEEQTIETFGGRDGKYFHTGDLGRRDEHGFLYVCGRIKGKSAVYWNSNNDDDNNKSVPLQIVEELLVADSSATACC
jgi:acyl-CoA synthetase (AMP-forming)/AMP-acid ligase II